MGSSIENLENAERCPRRNIAMQNLDIFPARWPKTHQLGVRQMHRNLQGSKMPVGIADNALLKDHDAFWMSLRKGATASSYELAQEILHGINEIAENRLICNFGVALKLFPSPQISKVSNPLCQDATIATWKPAVEGSKIPVNAMLYHVTSIAQETEALHHKKQDRAQCHINIKISNSFDTYGGHEQLCFASRDFSFVASPK
ncbi:uncharacterized protein PAC_09752 [Phialocephala subalpina]|uniref:Uncharacterized protein n=1 Tax=Phialocephala subalpina TaxID=576137 RepID=A0A1L7X4A1_9HELO|nr:uncharacterized protein PAC_09752 [Phialocephala subalpina]